MRKLQILGSMLVVLGALSALFTTSALALTFEPAKWLAKAEEILVALAAVTEGELLFHDLLVLAAEPEFLCSGKFIGSVGPGTKDEVTEVQNLSGVKITELDETGATNGIPCTVEKTCNTAEVWPVNLPWVSAVDLDTEDGNFYDLALLNAAGKTPAYFLLCEVFGSDNTELCETQDESWVLLKNAAGGLVESPAGAKFEPESVCGTASEVMGELEVDTSNTKLVSGEELSVSG